VLRVHTERHADADSTPFAQMRGQIIVVVVLSKASSKTCEHPLRVAYLASAYEPLGMRVCVHARLHILVGVCYSRVRALCGVRAGPLRMCRKNSTTETRREKIPWWSESGTLRYGRRRDPHSTTARRTSRARSRSYRYTQAASHPSSDTRGCHSSTAGPGSQTGRTSRRAVRSR